MVLFVCFRIMVKQSICQVLLMLTWTEIQEITTTQTIENCTQKIVMDCENIGNVTAGSHFFKSKSQTSVF